MTIKVEIKRLMNDATKKIRAFADVVIDDSIVIHSVSIVEGEKGLFVSMPRTTWTDKSGEKKSRDIVHPISSSASKEIFNAVITAYEAALNDGNNEAAD